MGQRTESIDWLRTVETEQRAEADGDTLNRITNGILMPVVRYLSVK